MLNIEESKKSSNEVWFRQIQRGLQRPGYFPNIKDKEPHMIFKPSSNQSPLYHLKSEVDDDLWGVRTVG